MRVSGAQSARLIAALARIVPKPRQATLRELRHDGQPIDRALVLFFPSPASFTGEDMGEFHIHGGRAVTRSLGEALQSLGARHAEPGEFTKRAFLNGKIDLTEAEAIADLIDAESAAQQAQALRQAGGALSRLYQGWSDRLTRCLAHAEASLDFPDEDLPDDMIGTVAVKVHALRGEIIDHLSDTRRGERLRHGVRIAILGAPNVGKSTLLNALAERDVAIVSSRAGTTRDVIETHLDLGGYPVILVDTAGLRDTNDEIEGEGIKRALTVAESADIRLLLFDATAERDAATLALRGETSLDVMTKADLAIDPSGTSGNLMVSVHTGEGLTELLARLASLAGDLCGTSTRPPPTRERHAGHLRAAEHFLGMFSTAPSPDLATEFLRIALSEIGRITGRVDIEDLLDIVFREFCIGK